MKGNLGPDQGSFTDDDGRPIDNGQFFIAINPDLFAARTLARTVDALMRSISDQEGAWLPNSRRDANRVRFGLEGLKIDANLRAQPSNFA